MPKVTRKDKNVGNPIQQWLDEFGVPWRLTLGELAERYGLKQEADGVSGRIDIPAPLLNGMIGPLTTRTYDSLSPLYPALDFGALISFSDNGKKAILRAKEELEPRFGRGHVLWYDPETRDYEWAFDAPSVSYLPENCVWHLGKSSVSMYAWDLPPEQDPHSSGHGNACHICVHTGYCPVLSPAEQKWLESFVAFAPIRMSHDDTLASVGESPVKANELAFVRDPGGTDISRVFGHIGFSADGAALLFCSASVSSQSCNLYVVPVANVIHFSVERLMPAKSAGGSWLRLKCVATGCKETSIMICWEPDPDGLNVLAERIAQAVGCSFELEPYANDC